MKTKDVLLGLLAGAAIGFCGGVVIGFIQCSVALVSCDKNTGMSDVWTTVLVITAIGAAIGLIVGIYKGIEEYKRDKAFDAAKEKHKECESVVKTIYNKEANVNFNNRVRRSIIGKLIAYRFYYDQTSDKCYLSVNTNEGGKKAIYEIKGRTYTKIRETDDSNGLDYAYVILGLVDETLGSIDKFNAMEELMPELKNYPYTTFYYSE